MSVGGIGQNYYRNNVASVPSEDEVFQSSFSILTDSAKKHKLWKQQRHRTSAGMTVADPLMGLS